MKLTFYQQRALEHAEAWVDGRVYHDHINDECCPDFSCCYPELYEQDRLKRVERLNHLRECYCLPKRFN